MKLMRAVAKQLDEAGIHYDAPIPPSDHKPDYGLSDSEYRKRVADLEFERCQSCRPLSREATSRKSMNILITC